MFMYSMQELDLTVPAWPRGYITCNARDHKVTGSSLIREVLFQLLEYWSRPWIEWQGMALSFSCNFVNLLN